MLKYSLVSIVSILLSLILYGSAFGIYEKKHQTTETEIVYVIKSRGMNPISRFFYLIAVCPDIKNHNFFLFNEIDNHRKNAEN